MVCFPLLLTDGPWGRISGIFRFLFQIVFLESFHLLHGRSLAGGLLIGHGANASRSLLLARDEQQCPGGFCAAIGFPKRRNKTWLLNQSFF